MTPRELPCDEPCHRRWTPGRPMKSQFASTRWLWMQTCCASKTHRVWYELSLCQSVFSELLELFSSFTIIWSQIYCKVERGKRKQLLHHCPFFRELSRPKGQGVTNFNVNKYSSAVCVGVFGLGGSLLVCVSAADTCPAVSH